MGSFLLRFLLHHDPRLIHCLLRFVILLFAFLTACFSFVHFALDLRRMRGRSRREEEVERESVLGGEGEGNGAGGPISEEEERTL